MKDTLKIISEHKLLLNGDQVEDAIRKYISSEVNEKYKIVDIYLYQSMSSGDVSATIQLEEK